MNQVNGRGGSAGWDFHSYLGVSNLFKGSYSASHHHFLYEIQTTSLDNDCRQRLPHLRVEGTDDRLIIVNLDPHRTQNTSLRGAQFHGVATRGQCRDRQVHLRGSDRLKAPFHVPTPH